MNTLLKLSETHYIIVDNSEIKKGWVTNGVECFLRESMPEYSDEYANRYWKNITHSTQPLDEKGYCWFGENCITHISLSEVEEAIYGYSVEKMAWKLFGGSFEARNIESEEEADKVVSFGVECFKAHQELVKNKLFTVEQVKKYHNIMCLHGNIKGEEYLQSLLPKTEWDIEFNENNKLKLIKL